MVFGVQLTMTLTPIVYTKGRSNSITFPHPFVVNAFIPTMGYEDAVEIAEALHEDSPGPAKPRYEDDEFLWHKQREAVVVVSTHVGGKTIKIPVEEAMRISDEITLFKSQQKLKDV